MTAKKPILVGVYGSLREGLTNHHILKQSPSVGDYLTEPKYTMYDLGSYPCIVEKGFTPIKLEIYSVTNAVLKDLHTLEGYYEANKEQSYYIPKTIKTPLGDVIIYVFNDIITSGTPIVENGDWFDYLTARNKK